MRLSLPLKINGKNTTIADRIFDERLLNSEQPRTVAPGKLFADLLKRQARRVMLDIGECPANTLPAHLARLDDLADIIGHATRHDLRETAESSLSGSQLGNPYTLADFAACLDLTRRDHRAPAFVNSRDNELAAINHKLDLLAGLVAGLLDTTTPQVFTNDTEEDER